MKYQVSRENKGDMLLKILEVVNYILLAIIVGSFNYLFVHFLF